MNRTITLGLLGVSLIALASCAQVSSDVLNTKQRPLDETSVLASAKTIHARALVVDVHADIEIPDKPSRYVGDDGLSKVAPDKLRAGGVDVVVMSAAVGPVREMHKGMYKHEPRLTRKLPLC